MGPSDELRRAGKGKGAARDLLDDELGTFDDKVEGLAIPPLKAKFKAWRDRIAGTDGSSTARSSTDLRPGGEKLRMQGLGDVVRSRRSAKGQDHGEWSGLAKALRAGRRSAHRDSDEESNSDELARGSLVDAKRNLSRKIAQQRPGELTVRFLHTIREYVSATGASTTEDEYGPIAMSYLASVSYPQHPPSQIGEGRSRELRALCEAIDGLLKGQVVPDLDVPVQRFEAKSFAAIEGSEETTR